MNWRKINTDINIENIKEIEKIIGNKLPIDFVDFIIKNNHGRPSKPLFDTEINSERMLGSLLEFNIGVKHSDNFLKVYSNLKNKIPFGFFPFASDPSGNYIIAEIKNEQISNVSFWNHELDFKVSDDNEMEVIEDSHSIELISKTFEDFMNILYL